LSVKRYKSTVSLNTNDFIVVGIHTDAPPFLASWCLCDTFSIQFVFESADFAINLLELEENKHNAYFFLGSAKYPKMWLVQNQGSFKKLVTNKPTPDYLLIIDDSDNLLDFESYFSQLKQIKHFLMIFSYPNDKKTKFVWLQELNHL
jgi:hypothetical protein